MQTAVQVLVVLALIAIVVGTPFLVALGILVLKKMSVEQDERREDRALRQEDRTERRDMVQLLKGYADSARGIAKLADEKASAVREEVRRDQAISKEEIKEQIKAELKQGTGPHATLPMLVAIFVLGVGSNLATTAVPNEWVREGVTMAKKKDVAALEKAVQDAWSAGNMVQAEHAANELMGAAPDNGVAHHVKGLLFEKDGRGDEAHAEYVIASKAGYFPAINRLAYLHRPKCGEATP